MLAKKSSHPRKRMEQSENKQQNFCNSVPIFAANDKLFWFFPTIIWILWFVKMPVRRMYRFGNNMMVHTRKWNKNILLSISERSPSQFRKFANFQILQFADLRFAYPILRSNFSWFCLEMAYKGSELLQRPFHPRCYNLHPPPLPA